MTKTSARYVDGFVLVVPKNQLATYRKLAQKSSKIWMKYGALDYKECVGDDLEPDTQGMKMLPFPKLTKLKSDELVIFSFVTYKSRAHRDQVNKKVMSDPFMNDMSWKDKPMPFDMKRMAYGGFKVLVSS